MVTVNELSREQLQKKKEWFDELNSWIQHLSQTLIDRGFIKVENTPIMPEYPLYHRYWNRSGEQISNIKVENINECKSEDRDE